MKFIKNILATIFPCFIKKRNSRIVWIVHPRNLADILKQISVFKFMPEKFVLWLLRHIPPYIISTLKTNGLASGYIIAIPLLPSDFKNNKKLALKRVRQAVKLAKELGIKKISVGGFLSSVVEKNNLSKEMGVNFFDGTNLLSHIITDKVQRIINASDNDISIAIIGATTKSGKLISKLVSKLNIKSLVLLGTTQSNLDNLREECCNNKMCTVNINATTEKRDIEGVDIVILTTYIPEDDEVVPLLKNGSVFIAAIEPTSPFVFDIEKQKPEVKVIKDIIVKTPGVRAGVRTGLPRNHSFVCLSEAIVHDDENSAKTKNTEETKELLEEYGFEA